MNFAYNKKNMNVLLVLGIIMTILISSTWSKDYNAISTAHILTKLVEKVNPTLSNNFNIEKCYALLSSNPTIKTDIKYSHCYDIYIKLRDIYCDLTLKKYDKVLDKAFFFHRFNDKMYNVLLHNIKDVAKFAKLIDIVTHHQSFNINNDMNDFNHFKQALPWVIEDYQSKQGIELYQLFDEDFNMKPLKIFDFISSIVNKANHPLS